MRVVEGRATVADLDAFLADLQAVADDHGVVVQTFDARYVAGRDHLEAAVTRAARAARRGETIARDPAVEILLYAAGRRQIDRALEMGVAEGTVPVVAVVVGAFPDDPAATGETEAAAARALAADWEPASTLDDSDEARICEFFEISAAERAATDASLSDLVCERVALLAVNK